MAAKVDSHCPIAKQAKIVGEWDCMLNQTNIGHNNNKYYVIQVVQQGLNYYAWNRWGRVVSKPVVTSLAWDKNGRKLFQSHFLE